MVGPVRLPMPAREDYEGLLHRVVQRPLRRVWGSRSTLTPADQDRLLANLQGLDARRGREAADPGDRRGRPPGRGRHRAGRSRRSGTWWSGTACSSTSRAPSHSTRSPTSTRLKEWLGKRRALHGGPAARRGVRPRVPARRAARRRARLRQEPLRQGRRRGVAPAAGQAGPRRALRQVHRRDRAELPQGDGLRRTPGAAGALDRRDREGVRRRRSATRTAASRSACSGRSSPGCRSVAATSSWSPPPTTSQRLPAELLRKGRFDETFFVDLPDEATRAADPGHPPAQAQAGAGAASTCRGWRATARATAAPSWSRSWSRRSTPPSPPAAQRLLDATALLLRDELRQMPPIASTAREKIAFLREWADGRTVPAELRSGPAARQAPAATGVAGRHHRSSRSATLGSGATSCVASSSSARWRAFSVASARRSRASGRSWRG